MLIYSIIRDNAVNNNRFLNTFCYIAKNSYRRDFEHDARYVNYIFNLITQDILKEYLNTNFSTLFNKIDNLSIEDNLEEEEEAEFIPLGYNSKYKLKLFFIIFY